MKKGNLAAFAVFALTLTVAAAPRLAVRTEGLRLAAAPVGAAARATATLVNVGDAPLAVLDARACCGDTAELAARELAPGESTMLTVRLTPRVPGEIFRTVTVWTTDPRHPEIQLTVTGQAIAAPDRWLAPAVLLAGLVDGFNPCAFSIAIVLAGILAAGGRDRRARLLAGWSFCGASFLTYLLMGLGLLRAVRALAGFRTAANVLLAGLSALLFVLSFLSFRDAARYRRQRQPSTLTLQLPDKVKRAIRAVAEASWRGPSVVLAGFVCGVLVTGLDALCTGQVYVPVLALIAREERAWRTLLLLCLYNVAFIAPLVFVFTAAAKGADSARLSRWSRRNVVPSKIALGLLFALLGILLVPGLMARCANWFTTVP